MRYIPHLILPATVFIAVVSRSVYFTLRTWYIAVRLRKWREFVRVAQGDLAVKVQSVLCDYDLCNVSDVYFKRLALNSMYVWVLNSDSVDLEQESEMRARRMLSVKYASDIFCYRNYTFDFSGCMLVVYKSSVPVLYGNHFRGISRLEIMLIREILYIVGNY